MGGEHSRTLSGCYQCGTCTGGCPVAKVTNGEYNPRKIIINSLLGLKQKLVETLVPNVWLCSTCQKCVESCPQGVELTEIFTLVRNMSVEAGTAAAGFTAQATTILETGFTIPPQPSVARRREKQLNLPPVPEAPLDEIQAILKETGWDKAIKYDWNATEGQ
ncbi:MAG: 4Fe-4S dicluster domain-containing protein [Promethearchaeota archaeon]